MEGGCGIRSLSLVVFRVILMVLLLSSLTALWAFYRDQAPRRVVEDYFEAVAALQWETAQQYLIGDALRNFQQNVSRDVPPAKILAINLSFTPGGPSSTVYEAVIDIAMSDPRIGPVKDRLLYLIYLERLGQGWRITRIEALPLTVRPSFFEGLLNSLHVFRAAEAEAVFQQYIESAARGEWRKAGAYLAGEPLHQAQTAPWLERAAFASTLVDLETATVLRGHQWAVVRATYKISNGFVKEQDMHINAEMVMIGGEWKIIRLWQS